MSCPPMYHVWSQWYVVFSFLYHCWTAADGDGEPADHAASTAVIGSIVRLCQRQAADDKWQRDGTKRVVISDQISSHLRRRGGALPACEVSAAIFQRPVDGGGGGDDVIVTWVGRLSLVSTRWLRCVTSRGPCEPEGCWHDVITPTVTPAELLS